MMSSPFWGGDRCRFFDQYVWKFVLRWQQLWNFTWHVGHQLVLLPRTAYLDTGTNGWLVQPWNTSLCTCHGVPFVPSPSGKLFTIIIQILDDLDGYFLMIHQFPRICIWIHKIYLQTLSATLKNGMVRFAFFKPCDGSIISGFPPREKHDFQVQRFWSSRFLHGASGCFISICWEHSDFSKQREHLTHQFGSVVSVVAIQNISKREKMVFSCIFFVRMAMPIHFSCHTCDSQKAWDSKECIRRCAIFYWSWDANEKWRDFQFQSVHWMVV